jgi:hypothetical protein
MTTANVSVVSVHNSTPNLLYTQSTDQFGATTFPSAGRASTVTFDTTDVSVGTLVGYTSSTGVFTLTGNVTYQLTASARLLNSVADQAALQWVDTTIGGTVGQPAKFDAVSSTNISYYTPTENTTVVLTAAISSPTAGLIWAYPAQLTNATAAVEAISGWTE